ncbi:MAG: hypothetical protein JNK15_20920, partial [Planctomycetes bacterium]|nr:hypothetical protein [Planctomycetota bacterium]
MPFRGPRRGRGPVALLALLAGCAAAPQPGWQAELANAYVDRTADFPVGERLLDGFDAVGAEPEPQVGDTLLYGLRLDTGGEPRVWYLRLRIDAIETKSWLEMREVLDFEERVSTPRVRQRRAEAEARWAAEGRPDLDSYRRDVPVARLRVEAFDAAGASLGAAESTESLYRLRIGLWSACVAGHARRELLRSLQGPDAPREVIDVEEAVYADVRCVADGVASCKSFFAIL